MDELDPVPFDSPDPPSEEDRPTIPWQATAPVKPPRPPINWANMALPVLILAVAGFALVTCVQMVALRPTSRFDYLSRNFLGLHGRMVMLATQGAGLFVPLLASLVLILRWPAIVQRTLPLVAALAGPIIPLGLLPALFNLQFSHVSQLNYLLLLAVFVLVFEPLVRRALQAVPQLEADRLRSLWRRRIPTLPSWAPLTLVLLGSAAYAAYFGYFTIINHHRVGTTAFDLGIYDNLMYNALHGRLFKSPVLFGPAGGNYIAGHAEFGMLLFLPFYAIHPGSETMLIIQAIVLGFSALPLYLFAARLLSPWMAASVAFTYLFFAPLHGPNFYDFHWLPMAIFFHFWLYYAIAARRNWLIALMLLVLFSLREDVAVGLVLLGLFLLVTGIRPRLGAILTVLAATWFVVVRFVIMPRAGNWYFQNLYNELFADGESSFASVIKTIVTNPVYFLGTILKENKLTYVLHLLVPLAFLPARRASFILLLLAGVFFTIMTTGYGPTVSISFQYTTHWIPYLFLTTVLALFVMGAQKDGNDGLVRQRAAVVTLLLANLAHTYNFGAVLQHENFVGGFSRIEFAMTAADKMQYAALKELTAMIPRDASVAATEHEVPHVSTRLVSYPMRFPLTPVDYILLGRSHLDNREVAAAALADPAYGLLAQRRDEFYLFKRGHQSPQTAAAKAQLGF